MAGLMGSKAPAIPAPVVMPTENNAAVTASEQAQLQQASAQSGRASTILSMNDISQVDKMGD